MLEPAEGFSKQSYVTLLELLSINLRLQLELKLSKNLRELAAAAVSLLVASLKVFGVFELNNNRSA